MIQSRDDLRAYISADKVSNHFNKHALFNNIHLYLISLRYVEYYKNCAPRNPAIWFYKYLYHKLSIKLGFTIPPNTFGKGLYIPHYGCIVINGTARFGDNCVVQCGVNVSAGVRGGDDLYLGAGAKILTNVYLSSGIIVGANSVVTRSFKTPNTVIAGVPAKEISSKGRYSNRSYI